MRIRETNIKMKTKYLILTNSLRETLKEVMQAEI